MSLTFEQELKIELVALAEYLQTQITDAQVRLYATELQSMSIAQLREAIARLKADPDVWSGRFPLPAKLKSYLTGTPAARAALVAANILAANSHSKLSSFEQAIVKQYGQKAVFEREASQSPTIFSQLKALALAAITSHPNLGELALVAHTELDAYSRGRSRLGWGGSGAESEREDRPAPQDAYQALSRILGEEEAPD